MTVCFDTGTDKIQVDWTAPAESNGALERYLVLTSSTRNSTQDVVYSSTDLFTSYVITNLSAGETYYVSVGVRTHQ